LVKLARQSIFVLQAKQPRTPIWLPHRFDQQVHNGLKYFFQAETLVFQIHDKIVFFIFNLVNIIDKKTRQIIESGPNYLVHPSNDVTSIIPAPLPYEAKDRLIGESN